MSKKSKGISKGIIAGVTALILVAVLIILAFSYVNNQKAKEKSTYLEEEKNNQNVNDENNNQNTYRNNENLNSSPVPKSRRAYTNYNQTLKDKKDNKNKVNYEIMKYVDIIGSCQNSIKKVNTADFITQIEKFFGPIHGLSKAKIK